MSLRLVAASIGMSGALLLLAFGCSTTEYNGRPDGGHVSSTVAEGGSPGEAKARRGGPEVALEELSTEPTVTLEIQREATAEDLGAARDARTGDNWSYDASMTFVGYSRVSRPTDVEKQELPASKLKETARSYAKRILGSDFSAFTEVVRPGTRHDYLCEYVLKMGSIPTFNRLVVNVGRRSGFPTNVIYTHGPVSVGLQPKVAKSRAEEIARKKVGMEATGSSLEVVRYPIRGQYLAWDVNLRPARGREGSAMVAIDASTGSILDYGVAVPSY